MVKSMVSGQDCPQETNPLNITIFPEMIYLGVSENVVYPIVPNGFANHYPVMKNG